MLRITFARACIILACSLPLALAPYPTFAGDESDDSASTMSVDALLEKFPDAEVVVEFEVWDVELEITNNRNVYSTEVRRVRKRLLRNVDEHASVVFPLGFHDELKSIQARTITPHGRTVELEKDEFLHSRGYSGGGTFYSDEDACRFTFPAVSPGCWVEFEIRTRSRYPFFSGSWWIQGAYPKLVSEFHLVIPEVLLGDGGWEWNYQIIGMPDLEPPTQSSRDGWEHSREQRKITFDWVVHDIPALNREPQMPPSRLYRSRVRFASGDWDNWNDPAAYYRRVYFNEQVKSDRHKVKALADRLVSNVQGDREQLRRLYATVRDYRYVSIELGEGGLRPTSPMEVVAREYGDCKDKSTLLVALLKAVDIEACPVLVQTSDNGRIDPDFVGWSFNHMIVRATTSDGKVWWMDPTASHCPLGQLPWMDQGIDVLVLHPKDGGFLERTPVTGIDDNEIHADVVVEIGKDTEPRVRVALRYTGLEALRQRWRLDGLTQDELEKHCRSMVRDAVLPVDDFECRVLDAAALDSELQLEFSFPAEGIAREQGGLLFLETELLRMQEWIPQLREEERRYPLEFGFPHRLVVTTTFDVQDRKWRPRDIPENVLIRSDVMRFTRKAQSSANSTIGVRSECELLDSWVTLEQWPQVFRFLRELSRTRSQQIILEEGLG